MHYLYILESELNNTWYIGITKNVQERLHEHNAGFSESTRRYRPYRLIYAESYATKTEARKREIALKKSGILRKQLKELLRSRGLIV